MNILIKSLSATALFLLTLSAHALSDQATPEQAATPGISPTRPGLHLVLNAGLTYGGDTIYKAVYTNGNTSNVKGGSLLQLGIGGLWQSDQAPVALMLSANYHFDNVSGTNGNLKFSRVPIEMLAYYTGKERFRIGGGIRLVNSPEAGGTVNGISDKITFDNCNGLVGEIGYQLSSQGWLNFRFVSEQYQGKTHTTGTGTTSLAGTAPISGSHLGMNFSYEF